jgi:hypothetical protein
MKPLLGCGTDVLAVFGKWRLMSIETVLRYCLFKSIQFMVREFRVVICGEDVHIDVSRTGWRRATKYSLGKSEQEANYTREQLLHISFLADIILDMVADTRLVDGSV